MGRSLTQKMCRLNMAIQLEDNHGAVAVIPLAPSRAEQLAGVLSRAFYNEPNFKYMIPDEQDRFRLLPRFFRIAIHAGLQYGENYTTQNVDGGALWIRPGRALTPGPMARTEFLSTPIELGWASFRRCMTVGARLEEIRGRVVPRAHWYLMALGVDPSAQGRGIGGRLIEPILSRADSERLPCYLETFNERNLTFYKRHGFRIAAAGNVPDGGPDFWAMIREPQS
jgi:GNAT superfamily N-acetyltransferase